MKQKNFNSLNEERGQFLVSDEMVDDVDDVGILLYKNEKEAIVGCVKHHQIILRMCHKFQNIYSIFVASEIFYTSE